MRLEDLSWFDVQRYLEQDDRLMIVVGSCEQHAYLSLATDVKIPLSLADAASQQTGVLVAPSVNYGISPYFLDYPGTFSIRISTLIALIDDILKSAYRQGFRRILILNGHGGNDPARIKVLELLNELVGLKVHWYSWWESHSLQKLAQELQLKPSHANWVEAFPFVRVADLPEEKKLPPSMSGLISAREARQIYGDGSFGGPYQANGEIYDRLFKIALMDILVQLEF